MNALSRTILSLFLCSFACADATVRPYAIGLCTGLTLGLATAGSLEDTESVSPALHKTFKLINTIMGCFLMGLGSGAAYFIPEMG